MVLVSFSAAATMRTTPQQQQRQQTVCVIGCGPGGMFFLHALASRRKRLEEECSRDNNSAEALAALAALPIVECYEKSSSPGGVWRSATEASTEDEEDVTDSAALRSDSPRSAVEVSSENHDEGNINDADEEEELVGSAPPKKNKADEQNESTQMYEALWINGNKEVQEFFDYTFDEHFKRPMPVYLPRKDVLDYVLHRVTTKENIFSNVKFSTTVISVEYCNVRKVFDVCVRDERTGSILTKQFDKCIWSGGLNARPRIPTELTDMLRREKFQGRVIHSTQMKDFEATVRGKRVMFVGDSYSAEDLALQSLKLGAERVYITSRGGYGTASYVGAWPGNRVEILWYMLPQGVTSDGRGLIVSKVEWNSETERYEPKKVGGKTIELKDISTVVLCTGYRPNMDCLSDELKAPWRQTQPKRVWSVPDGWTMEPNCLSADVGEVTPSDELTGGEYYVKSGLYRHTLISNPSMMFLYETTSYPLLDIDVAAWLCLAYICGDVELPSADEMKRQNDLQSLDEMNVPYLRYYKDKNYYAALNKLPQDHWWRKYTSSEYENYSKDYSRYQTKLLARDMVLGNYPAGFGTYEKLSERGELIADMTASDSQGRYKLKSSDPDSAWRTFRDCDPEPFKSIFTGTKAVPLKGKWMDLDAAGNVIEEAEEEEKEDNGLEGTSRRSARNTASPIAEEDEEGSGLESCSTAAVGTQDRIRNKLSAPLLSARTAQFDTRPNLPLVKKDTGIEFTPRGAHSQAHR